MNHLEKPGDTIYIQDRKKLFKLAGYTCNSEQSSFTSKTQFDDTIVICFKTRKFNAADHKVDLNDTVFKYIHNEKRIDYFKGKNLIDGEYAYGIDGNEPRVEFHFIEIIWGKHWLEIPEKAYKNLFDAHLCKNYIPVEAYITNNGKLLFVYFHGSDGAGAYTAKLVFNRKRYVTRVINTSEMSIGYDFLDCTAK
ncbi:MAG TPA: hypothetical protein VK154_10365 [Chitinophagales bacterium]|nr:hypothetical protein [Chitinophagales bacterium]